MHYEGKVRPNLYIDPKHSVVIQIKASEILSCSDNAIKYTLRFPRPTKARYDKNWDEVMTVEEFHSLRLACGGMLAKRSDGRSKRNPYSNQKNYDYSSDSGAESPEETSDEECETTPAKQAKLECKPISSNTTPIKISPKKCLSPQKKTSIVTPIFTSKTFCLFGTVEWKKELETKIESCGGTIVQNPVPDIFAVVAEKKTFPRVEGAIRMGKYNVMKPDWITESIQSNKEAQLKPSHFWFYTKTMQKTFANLYDDFGDSYTETLSVIETKSLVEKLLDKNLDNTTENEEEIMTVAEVKAAIQSQDLKLSRWDFFHSLFIAFRGPVDPVAAAQIEFYGGTVLQDETDERSTHVIVKDRLSPKKKNHCKAMVVNYQWLEACFRLKQLVNEMQYQI